jgi:hypothetical protein
MDEVGRAILAHHPLGIANRVRCERGGTKLAGVVDQRSTEPEALHLVARKGTRDVAGAGSQFLREGRRIKRGFRDACRECGRATKAASPRSATRPNAMLGASRSVIACSSGCSVRAMTSAIIGGSSATASRRIAAMTSTRISGGGIAKP